ncbi:MAG: patatin-like phospholipase family protein [Chloroflexota bacterium]
MTVNWKTSLPRPLAFVLSGGGSLGAIQVGMLKALASLQVEPDLIVGTSVGALNGAAIASYGMFEGVQKLEALWQALTKQDIFPGGRLSKLRQIWTTQSSIYPNNGLAKVICSMLPVETFEELSIPFAALATDIMTLHGALFNKGNVHKALLASTAIPAFFPPVEVNGRLYADGGITANVPLKSAMLLGAKSIVVLDAGEMCHRTHAPENWLGYFELGLQGVMRQRVRIEAPAVAEKVPLVYLPTPCPLVSDFFDFSYSQSLIEESCYLTEQFLKNEKLPHIGQMSGAPHYHGDEPIFSLTEPMSAV